MVNYYNVPVVPGRDDGNTQEEEGNFEKVHIPQSNDSDKVEFLTACCRANRGTFLCLCVCIMRGTSNFYFILYLIDMYCHNNRRHVLPQQQTGGPIQLSFCRESSQRGMGGKSNYLKIDGLYLSCQRVPGSIKVSKFD